MPSPTTSPRALARRRTASRSTTTPTTKLHSVLRYGENPHQQAAFYTSRKAAGATLATAKQIQGKELSYNNLADADAALQTVLRFPERPACIIVKHANPCGAALGDNILAAYDAAHRCDSTSAFGGIIAFKPRPGRRDRARKSSAASSLKCCSRPPTTTKRCKCSRKNRTPRP